MRNLMTSCAILLISMPEIAKAQQGRADQWSSYHGHWARTQDECNSDSDHPRYFVSANEVRGYEFSCRIVRRERAGDGFAVDTTCSGEGATYRDQFVFSPATRGRLRVTTVRQGRRQNELFERCPTQSAATASQPRGQVDQPNQQDFETSARQQLSCQSKPNGLPAIIHLGRASMIDVRQQSGYDSISCWQIRGMISVRGLSISRVCYVDNDPLITSLWGHLFWRGPGTAPPPTFAVFSRQSRQEVERWAQENLPANNGSPRWRVETSPIDASETGVTCSRDVDD